MHVIMGNPEQLLRQEHYDEGLLAQALLDTYYAPLLRLAYSLTGDSATAEDIVQETLLVALDKIDQYEPGTDLKAWLCRIAIFTSRNTIRRRKLREKWYEIWTRVAATRIASTHARTVHGRSRAGGGALAGGGSDSAINIACR